MDFNKVERTLAEVLADIYMNIPWNKVKVSNAFKFYKDRVYNCTNCINFKEYLDKLCLKCNVSFIRLSSGAINFLMENNTEVMNLLRKETLFIVNYALDIVEKRKMEQGKF